jgi:hypothetical protein
MKAAYGYARNLGVQPAAVQPAVAERNTRRLSAQYRGADAIKKATKPAIATAIRQQYL